MSQTVRRTDPAPGSGSPPPHLARGALHARHIVFMVVAAAAPMAVVVAIMPIAFFLGNGVGTPRGWAPRASTSERGRSCWQHVRP